MSWLARWSGVVLFSACYALAGARDGAVLDYQLKYQRRSESAWVETRFRLIITPPLVTRQKHHLARLGGWRIEALPGKGPAASAAVLAQAAGLMYFAGPAVGVVPRDAHMVLGHRSCHLWQAPAPPGVAAYAYLAEVAPGLLALSYLTASLGEGDLAALELHLQGVSLGAHVGPAEDGSALLRTLARWSALRPLASAGAADALEPERVD